MPRPRPSAAKKARPLPRVDRIRLRTRARRPTEPPLPSGPTRIRIYLRSVDHRVVDQAAVRLTEVAERGRAIVEGPIPLPSVPAQIEGLRTHVRRLDLIDAPPELLASLANFDLPSGVEIELAG